MEFSDAIVNAKMAFADAVDPTWSLYPEADDEPIEQKVLPMDVEDVDRDVSNLIDDASRLGLVRVKISELLNGDLTYDRIHALKPPANQKYATEPGFVYWPALIFQSCTEYYEYDRENVSTLAHVSLTKASIRELLSDPSIYKRNPTESDDRTGQGQPLQHQIWRIAELLGRPDRAFCLVDDADVVKLNSDSLFMFVRSAQSNPKIFSSDLSEPQQQAARELYIEFHFGLDVMSAIYEPKFMKFEDDGLSCCEERCSELLQKLDEATAGAVSRVSESSANDNVNNFNPPGKGAEVHRLSLEGDHSPPVRLIHVDPSASKPAAAARSLARMDDSSLETNGGLVQPSKKAPECHETPTQKYGDFGPPISMNTHEVDEEGYTKIDDLRIPILPGATWDQAWATLEQNGWSTFYNLDEKRLYYQQPFLYASEKCRDYTLEDLQRIARERFGWIETIDDSASDCVANKPKLGSSKSTSTKMKIVKKLNSKDAAVKKQKTNGRRGRPLSKQHVNEKGRPGNGKPKKQTLTKNSTQLTKTFSSSRRYQQGSSDISLDDPSHSHYGFYRPFAGLWSFLKKDLGWKYASCGAKYSLLSKSSYLFLRPGKSVKTGTFGVDFFGDEEDVIAWCQKERLHEQFPGYDQSSVSSVEQQPLTKGNPSDRHPGSKKGSVSVPEFRNAIDVRANHSASEHKRHAPAESPLVHSPAKRAKTETVAAQTEMSNNNVAAPTKINKRRKGKAAEPQVKPKSSPLQVDPSTNEAPWVFETLPENFGPWPILHKLGFHHTGYKYHIPGVDDQCFDTTEEVRCHLCKYGVPANLSALNDQEKLHFEIWVARANLPPYTRQSTMATVPLISASNAIRLLKKLGFMRKGTTDAFLAPKGSVLDRDGPSTFNNLSRLRFWLRGAKDLAAVLVEAGPLQKPGNRSTRLHTKKYEMPLSDRELLALRLWATASNQELPVEGLEPQFVAPSDGSIDTSKTLKPISSKPLNGAKSSRVHVSTSGDSSKSKALVGVPAPDKLPSGSSVGEFAYYSSSSSVSTEYDPVCHRRSVWELLQRLGFHYSSGSYSLPPNFQIRPGAIPKSFPSIDETLKYICTHGVPNLDRHGHSLTQKEKEHLNKAAWYAYMPNNMWGKKILRLNDDQAWEKLKNLGFAEAGDCYYSPDYEAEQMPIRGKHFFDTLVELRAFLRGVEDLETLGSKPAGGHSRRLTKKARNQNHGLNQDDFMSLRLWGSECTERLPQFQDDDYVDTLPMVQPELSKHVLEVVEAEDIAKDGEEEELAHSETLVDRSGGALEKEGSAAVACSEDVQGGPIGSLQGVTHITPSTNNFNESCHVPADSRTVMATSGENNDVSEAEPKSFGDNEKTVPGSYGNPVARSDDTSVAPTFSTPDLKSDSHQPIAESKSGQQVAPASMEPSHDAETILVSTQVTQPTVNDTELTADGVSYAAPDTVSLNNKAELKQPFGGNEVNSQLSPALFVNTTGNLLSNDAEINLTKGGEETTNQPQLMSEEPINKLHQYPVCADNMDVDEATDEDGVAMPLLTQPIVPSGDDDVDENGVAKDDNQKARKSEPSFPVPPTVVTKSVLFHVSTEDQLHKSTNAEDAATDEDDEEYNNSLPLFTQPPAPSDDDCDDDHDEAKLGVAPEGQNPSFGASRFIRTIVEGTNTHHGGKNGEAQSTPVEQQAMAKDPVYECISELVKHNGDVSYDDSSSTGGESVGLPSVASLKQNHTDI